MTALIGVGALLGLGEMKLKFFKPSTICVFQVLRPIMAVTFFGSYACVMRSPTSLPPVEPARKTHAALCGIRADRRRRGDHHPNISCGPDGTCSAGFHSF